MKALILAGGKGTRLRPLTYSGAKQLVPVANKPILWYCIAEIVAAGIVDIGIIISPETGLEVKTKTGNGENFGAKITYILQNEPNGLAHAVKVAHSFLGDSNFIMYLGDNLIQPGNLNYFLQKFELQQPDALILLSQVTNPKAFGVATVDETGKVLQLVEKPKLPLSNLALVGVYFFSGRIHKAIADIKYSLRGELEITDAIQWLIDKQYQVIADKLEGWWLDTGKKDDLLEANSLILDAYLTTLILSEIDDNNQISGRVQIGQNTKLINCHIRGPAIIGNNCYLENCYIGSFTSIADNTELIDTHIEYSIVLESAYISGISQPIIDSVIGQRVRLAKTRHRSQALRFMIGDDCQIELI